MFDDPNTSSYLSANDQGILVVEALKSIKPISWIKDHKDEFNLMLLKFGGILLRHFAIDNVSDFKKISEAICPNLMDYEYSSTPRTNIENKIYTATEYPANQSIPLHNEQSYAKSWPNKIIFFCLNPAEQGGETPVADSRKVFKRIPLEIVDRFNQKQILYVRNYTNGIDLSWQSVFKTSDKLKVAAYCQYHSIDYLWNQKGPELTTKQRCQATIIHPITMENVWFNQAHLFHISNLPNNIADFFIKQLGKNAMPRNAYYGDGTDIEKEVLEMVRLAYDQESLFFTWKKHDLLILDNILMAHGRRPYSGERKIVVAMGN